MPYVRRRKTGVAKRRYVRKGSPKVSKATKTYVKKALTANKQLNYANLDNSSSNMSFDVPFLAQWSAVAQGNTIDSREGDRLEPTLLEINSRVSMSAVTDVARIIVFQWRPDTDAELPTMGKILQITGSAQSVYSPYVLNEVDRAKFVVLKDRTFHSNPDTLYFHFRCKQTKFMNKYISYNIGVTSGKSQIYVLAFSNIASAGTEPTWNKVAYLYWKDTA